MDNNNRQGRSGGRSRRGGVFRRNSGRREMHKAVCGNCGNDCEVPFRPSGDKPVYCSNCFEKMGGGGSSRSSRASSRRDFRKKEDNSKEMLNQLRSLNEKLDKIFKVIENGLGKELTQNEASVKKENKEIAKGEKSKIKKTRKVKTKPPSSKK